MLFVGLGNPDPQYLHSRHNIGQHIIDSFVADTYHTQLRERSFLKSRLYHAGHCYFAVPTTYMNESGLAVAKLLSYYKIAPNDLYVIHDDLDIGVGEYRLQFGRGAAGHHGVESIIDQIHTNQFHRLRLGIGHPTDQTPVEKYVLQPLLPSPRSHLENTIDQITLDQLTLKIHTEIHHLIASS